MTLAPTYVPDATHVDLRLTPGRTTRQEFHRQIAHLEAKLTTATTQLDPAHRPPVEASEPATPRLLSDQELETVRDALIARLTHVRDLVDRQESDYQQARALLKRMSDAPAEFRWTTVSTKDLGVDGCKTWQSVPVLGPIGMLGNWWRIRMSSGCP